MLSSVMFDRGQKALFAEKFMDLANLVAAALVVGQAFSEKINWPALFFGTLSYILILVMTYVLQKGIKP